MNEHYPERLAQAKRDIVLASLLFLGVIAVMIESMRLTFFIELPATGGSWTTAPGIFPLFLSMGLLVMLASVIVHSIRSGALKTSYRFLNIVKWLRRPEQSQRIRQAALLLLYVFVAIPFLPFTVATAMYLFASMRLAKSTSMYWILFLSIAIPVIIQFILSDLIKLPLP